MKLIQQLLEMAKSKSKRASQAKRRRKKKLETPTQDAKGNPVALAAQTSGAGYHGTEFTKEKKGKSGRREAKKSIRKEMDY